jgi:uncharacterized membrane protein YgaE (UPF0421/DUF939 family)
MDTSAVIDNVKSAGVTAAIGAAGIGIQYADINEFTKAVIGIGLAVTVVFRAASAVLDFHRKLKSKDKTNEQTND